MVELLEDHTPFPADLFDLFHIIGQSCTVNGDSPVHAHPPIPLTKPAVCRTIFPEKSFDIVMEPPIKGPEE